MRLPDGPRQIVAGIIAAGLFLGLFFGLYLIWWLALALAVAGYFAALLLIRRRTPLDEIRLGERVSAADVAEAALALNDASARLLRAVRLAPEGDQAAIGQMAGHLQSIRKSIEEDPEDYRAARRFINVYLPNIVRVVETYVKLSGEAQGNSAGRVAGLSSQIRGFLPVIERIQAACIENDLAALEVEVEVLSNQFGAAPRDKTGGSQ